MNDLLTFERFVPGMSMGRSGEVVESAVLAQWKHLYPHDEAPPEGSAPLGLAVVLMMRAYMKILSPRPPGNIHAAQRMHIFEPMRLDERVTMEMICRSKQMRGDKKFVDFDLIAMGEERRPLFDGVLTIIWAL